MLVALIIRFLVLEHLLYYPRYRDAARAGIAPARNPRDLTLQRGRSPCSPPTSVVTALTAAANTFAATVDFTRPDWLLRNMAKARVPQSWLFSLGALKAAGALGLLIGIGVPLLGVAASVGLVLFFIGALITHFGARYWAIAPPVAFLLLAVGSLVLRLASS